MDAKKIGNFICEHRKKLNLTQKQLADKLSVTYQAVSKWENGRGIPDVEFLRALSQIFDVDINDLIEGTTIKTPSKKKTNKKKLVILIILVLLISIIIFLFVNRNNDYNFHNVVSDNSCFGVKGVVAYNKNKKSIYISSIECSSSEKRVYLDIECSLYEKEKNITRNIQDYGSLEEFNTYDINKLYTLNELLSNVEFNVDNYDCSCNSKECNNLFINIKALNSSNEVINYDIPIELDKNCNNKNIIK